MTKKLSPTMGRCLNAAPADWGPIPAEYMALAGALLVRGLVQINGNLWRLTPQRGAVTDSKLKVMRAANMHATGPQRRPITLAGQEPKP